MGGCGEVGGESSERGEQAFDGGGWGCAFVFGEEVGDAVESS